MEDPQTQQNPKFPVEGYGKHQTHHYFSSDDEDNTSKPKTQREDWKISILITKTVQKQDEDDKVVKDILESTVNLVAAWKALGQIEGVTTNNNELVDPVKTHVKEQISVIKIAGEKK